MGILNLYIRIRYGKDILAYMNLLKESSSEHSRNYILYHILRNKSISSRFVRRHIFPLLTGDEQDRYNYAESSMR